MFFSAMRSAAATSRPRAETYWLISLSRAFCKRVASSVNASNRANVSDRPLSVYKRSPWVVCERWTNQSRSSLNRPNASSSSSGTRPSDLTTFSDVPRVFPRCFARSARASASGMRPGVLTSCLIVISVFSASSTYCRCQTPRPIKT